jgi:hypothetical protein
MKERNMYPKNDEEFEDKVITEVDKNFITTGDGWSIAIPDDCTIKRPKVGEKARFYGKGIGYIVRGLFVNGIKVFYKTPAEQGRIEEEAHRKYEEEDRLRELEPKNPDPQIPGFEWTDDMREISGFHSTYEKACRTMVSLGCKWWSEHPEANPEVKSFKNITGIATTENNDAKKLEIAMMAGCHDDCTGAMHHYSLLHIFLWHKLGSWADYQKAMRTDGGKYEAGT